MGPQQESNVKERGKTVRNQGADVHPQSSTQKRSCRVSLGYVVRPPSQEEKSYKTHRKQAGPGSMSTISAAPEAKARRFQVLQTTE